MSRSRRRNTNRREARRSLPIRNSLYREMKSTTAPRRGPSLREILRSPDAPARLREAFGLTRQRFEKTMRSTTVSPSKTNKQTKSVPYRAPNWKLVSATVDAVQKKSSKDHSLCKQRDERKEVLFASQKTGLKGQKSPVWTAESRISCRKK